jgi:hypothetical protein
MPVLCRKGKFISIYKIAAFIVLSGGLLFLPLMSSAQDLPCDGSDPYDTDCPLDTWVWVLAAIALIFGAIQLYRQQKIHSKI